MAETRQDLLDTLAKPPPEPSELDILMQTDPLELTKDNIDSIIAYQRKVRAQREAASKPGARKKAAAESREATTTLNLAALGLIKAAPKPAAPTPTGSGFRRL